MPRPLPGEFLYKGPSDIVMVRRQDGYDLDGARGFLRTDRAAMRAEYAGTPWPPDVDVARRVLSRSK